MQKSTGFLFVLYLSSSDLDPASLNESKDNVPATHELCFKKSLSKRQGIYVMSVALGVRNPIIL